MKQSEHLLYQAKLNSLTPRERQTYFELVRLAANEDTIDENTGIPISKGSAIISYKKLEKYLDLTRSTIRRALTRLVEKDLIELTSIGRTASGDNLQFRTIYRIKHIEAPQPVPSGKKHTTTPVEAIYELENQNLRHHLKELQALRKKLESDSSASDLFLFDLMEEAYHIALETIAAKDRFLSVKKGILIEDENQDCQLLIQGDQETSSGIDLKVRAALAIISAIEKSIDKTEHKPLRQAYGETLLKACRELLNT
ncbi:hypothetical protein [Thermoactinomyces mirandus]|uniref:Uncharacterized protein n=1 Tax=Thermoactinomyces mirandus TaxID=2756294 RepID=A0A7W1XPV1_9BACL|nr:hypothetical protein [Thermoactinomyces mirandus]MBA4600945.1 hypothetical protein [Thermoactinomyces mirandus]